MQRDRPVDRDERRAQAGDPDGIALYDPEASDRRLRAALTGGDVPIAVYGLGKMGLPLAAVYAERMGNVIGVDIDPTVVESITAGESHVVGEPGLDELVAEQVAADRLRATTEGTAAARTARVHVIIVPTLIDENGEPTLTTVEAVVDDIAAGLEPGDLVIAESTLPPGSCRDVLLPHLTAESGLDPGEFGLAFCPERTSSGTALRDIRDQYPKVVGGIDPDSTDAATIVYDELSTNEVHPVSDATTAEAVKVFEGVYRDVNIALANELGRLADELGISVREAIETANDLPMCQLHQPGPGVGGHCIPYYPHFLLAQASEPLALTRTAREVNDGMPAVVVDRLEAELASTGVALDDATVAVLGLTYRPGVEETRASPAFGVVSALSDRGAAVVAVDPLVDPADHGIRSIDRDQLADAALDGAVLVTPHEEFETISWADLDPMVVVDGRDALSLADSHHRTYTLAGSRDGRPPRAERAQDGETAPHDRAARSSRPETDGGSDV